MTTSTTTQPESAGIAWPALIWIGLLHLGALLAFVPAFFSWQALLLCVVLHWVTGGLGISLTYHRLLTHRSFEVRPEVARIRADGHRLLAPPRAGAIGWVADHRRHHAHSDERRRRPQPEPRLRLGPHVLVDDPRHHLGPHPRILQEVGPRPVQGPGPSLDGQVPHPLPDPAGAVALYAIGGMPYLVWGFFVRSVLVLHSTWLVNSATHVWGYRSHETRDNSTNLWWVALSPTARAGTTTTTPSRPRPATACGGGSST